MLLLCARREIIGGVRVESFEEFLPLVARTHSSYG
jgi:hypothetical protein